MQGCEDVRFAADQGEYLRYSCEIWVFYWWVVNGTKELILVLNVAFCLFVRRTGSTKTFFSLSFLNFTETNTLLQDLQLEIQLLNKWISALVDLDAGLDVDLEDDDRLAEVHRLLTGEKL